ncbi:hypothetical protein Y032_0037g3389 [Ancylostoma ceylanicum]|uniref:Uncharacterized protein n=1 Tax=Ancylostoma ceylanicum TaxID=53326 RepID=A0A016UIL8_9BILA|nr:hypothetical protein Y032_0037g3389 [Ancylostoma ceylanicum]
MLIRLMFIVFLKKLLGTVYLHFLGCVYTYETHCISGPISPPHFGRRRTLIISPDSSTAFTTALRRLRILIPLLEPSS